MFDFTIINIILFACLAYISSFFLLRITETSDDRAYKRLKGLIEVTIVKQKKDKVENNLMERIVQMLEARVKDYVEAQIKKGRLGNLNQKLQQAGMNDVTTNQFWTRAVVYGILLSFVGLITGKLIIALVAFGLGVYYPFYKLKQKISKRHFILLNQLPDYLDLVSVTYPATSNIEETFELVAAKSESEVAKEFKIAVNEIKIGRRKRDVFQDLARRTGIKEISTLISQINQAETFGSGLEEVLVAQAKTIRHNKKIVAQKRGNTASNLIYIPAMLMLGVSMGIVLFPFVMEFIGNIGAFQ